MDIFVGGNLARHESESQMSNVGSEIITFRLGGHLNYLNHWKFNSKLSLRGNWWISISVGLKRN